MENLLHYIWKYRLYTATSLTTVDGLPLDIIDPGVQNTDSGPDFFNAKIMIDGTLWAGSVEIHLKASDWKAHNHHADKAYDVVILHVVGESDCVVRRTNGEVIPQFRLVVDESLRRNMDWLLGRDVPVPCLYRLREIEPLHRTMWLDALLSERLERKTDDICRWLDICGGDWNEAFYIALCRNFGFGVNSDAFERLARSLPFRFIRKQRASGTQVEALFFGQAGLLEADEDDHYYRLLQREYKFLAHKFSLKPLDATLFRSLRMRPGTTPHLKLAQLAMLWVRYDTLFSALLEAKTPGEIKQFFRVSPSEYWKTHYRFGVVSPEKDKPLGEAALGIILINTVVPMFFAYSKKRSMPEYAGRALRLLETIPAEDNSIVSTFRRGGLVARHAGESQSLIQLKREYCEKKKCLFCRFGFQLLKKGNTKG